MPHNPVSHAHNEKPFAHAPDWVRLATHRTCTEAFQKLTNPERHDVALVVIENAVSPLGITYLNSLTLRDWKENQQKNFHKTSNHNALVIEEKGWLKGQMGIEQACDSIASQITPFFPEGKKQGSKQNLIVHLAQIAAVFARLTDAQMVRYTLNLTFGTARPLDFTFGDGQRGDIKASLNLLGPSRHFLSPHYNHLKKSDKMEHHAITLPQNSLALWQGRGGKIPLKTSQPPIAEQGVRLSLALRTL